MCEKGYDDIYLKMNAIVWLYLKMIVGGCK